MWCLVVAAVGGFPKYQHEAGYVIKADQKWHKATLQCTQAMKMTVTQAEDLEGGVFW